MIQIQLCVAADALLHCCCCCVSRLHPLLQMHSLTVFQKEQLLQCCHAPLPDAAASCGGLLLQPQLQGPLQSK
jgi:hypothetical protein